MEIAKLLDEDFPRYNGKTALFELSTPAEYQLAKSKMGKTNYVMYCNIFVPKEYKKLLNGQNSFMFPAKKDGEIIDYKPISWSMKGNRTYQEVLLNGGYVLVSTSLITPKLKLNIK